LAVGGAAGAVAIAGLVVLRFARTGSSRTSPAEAGLPALVLSLLAGVTTLGPVSRRRYEAAATTAVVADAATIAGWALAQQPHSLSDLTIQDAAAGHDTPVAVIVAVVAGAVILFRRSPSSSASRSPGNSAMRRRGSSAADPRASKIRT
jgi:cytochrome bd ubiquinol oxidase subunit II